MSNLPGARSTSRVRSGSSTLGFLNQLDSTSIQFGVIELIKSVLHTAALGKFNNAETKIPSISYSIFEITF